MLNCCRKKQYQGFTGNMVGRLAFFKRRLEETTVIEPFLIHHITIQVIVQYLHFLVVLGVEDESFIITQRITFHHFTDNL